MKIRAFCTTNILLLFALLSFTNQSETSNFKCMIQLTNYSGESAYITVSLLDEEGNYTETLYVQGEDSDWYNEISEWWKFYGKRRPNIDAITGPTVKPGERSLSILKIPTDKIDSGYSIRFESAVEDQEYYTEDVQFKLTTENLSNKVEGTGFIRYIRMIAQ